MNTELVLTVVGGLLAIVGSVNAFFIRDLIGKINSIHIDFIETKSMFKMTEIHSAKNTEDIIYIKRELEKHRFRLHNLEGASSSLLKMLKENDGDFTSK